MLKAQNYSVGKFDKQLLWYLSERNNNINKCVAVMFPSNVSMVWTTSHVTPDSVVWHLQGNESKFMMVHCCAFSPSTRRTWDSGCLPFTWANNTVHGVGKWFAKLRTRKFRPGIAHGFEGTEHESPFGISSIGKNTTTTSDVPLLSEIFRWEDLKSRVPFTFQPDFPENFC